MYSGSKWIEGSLGITNMSPLGKRVADILGFVWKGIYHLDTAALKRVDWSNKMWISIVLYCPQLATWDFNTLTELVVVCHDLMIRLEINPRSFKYIELVFHQRKGRTGEIHERMPTIDDQIENIRLHYEREGYYW